MTDAALPQGRKGSLARTISINFFLGGLIVAFACLSLTIGYVDYSIQEVVSAAFGFGHPKTVTIVQELRMPRMILALMIGAAMGLSGAVLQGLLRNPLAVPGIIGVTSAAGLGAIVAIYFGLSRVYPYALPFFAMSGAAMATMLLYAIAARTQSSLTLILAGVAVNGICIALQSLAMNLSPNPWAVNEMIFWLLGSVKDRSFTDVGIAAPFVLLGCAILLLSARALDALTLGEDGARSLGIDLERLRIIAIVGTSLAVGASVSVSGSVAFIGLVVPHLLRPYVGYTPSRLLIPSALGGATLLLAADIIIRLISQGTELHLGVVTSLLGAPFFLYLILKGRHRTT